MSEQEQQAPDAAPQPEAPSADNDAAGKAFVFYRKYF